MLRRKVKRFRVCSPLPPWRSQTKKLNENAGSEDSTIKMTKNAEKGCRLRGTSLSSLSARRGLRSSALAHLVAAVNNASFNKLKQIRNFPEFRQSGDRHLENLISASPLLTLRGFRDTHERHSNGFVFFRSRKDLVRNMGNGKAMRGSEVVGGLCMMPCGVANRELLDEGGVPQRH